MSGFIALGVGIAKYEEKEGDFASSLGTVFEWYDFYLTGTLAAFIGAAFFQMSIRKQPVTSSLCSPCSRKFSFVRPFGALVSDASAIWVGRNIHPLLPSSSWALRPFWSAFCRDRQ